MRITLLLLSGALVVGSLPNPSPSQPAKGPSSLEKDLRTLQGKWYPLKTEEKLSSVFELTIHKSGLVISYGEPGGGGMTKIVNLGGPFELKQDGNKRRIIPNKKAIGVSEITYRVEGDRLTIEEGTCGAGGDKISLKGEWKRTREQAP
jgi:hypothetical protein